MGYKHNIEDIIDTGTRLFRKKGYYHVGVKEILETSGIPKGSFYNFFDNKEDFAVQGIVAYGASSLDYIQSFLRNESFTPLERLKNLYTDIIQGNIADGMDAGCMINVLSMDVGAHNKQIGDAANIAFSKWLEEIALCVKQAQAADEIRKDFTPLEIAEYLHAGTYGGFSRMKVTHSVDYLKRWYDMTFEFISVKHPLPHPHS